MRKETLTLAVAVSMAGLLAGCGNTSATPNSTQVITQSPNQSEAPSSAGDLQTGESAYPKMDLDLACVYAASSGPALGAQRFKELVEERTKGSITINLFTDGSLGTEKDNFTQLAADEIPLVVGGIQPIDMYATEYQFLSAPYMITSWDHLDAVLESSIGQGLYEKLEENNIHAMALCRRGIRQTCATKEIRTPADLQGVKFRVSEITSWVAFWKGVGAQTTSVALTELYSALQTHVVDACEGPYEQMATNKLYEVQNYVINTDHIYEPTWLYMSDRVYQGLDDRTRTLLDECAKEAMDYGTQQAAELSESWRQEMEDGGCTMIDPDVEAFRNAAVPVLKDLFDSMWTVTTYDEVMSYSGK